MKVIERSVWIASVGLKAKGIRIEISRLGLVPEAMGIIQSALNGRERGA